jgi:hypothetical protein
MKKAALLLALLAGCGSGCDARHGVAVISSLESPDGIHTAVAYSDMGGGAAGWCYICFDVVSGTPNTNLLRCSPAQQWLRCDADVKLTWQSSQSLVVSHTGGRVALANPPSQLAVSTPSVTISFEEVNVTAKKAQ